MSEIKPYKYIKVGTIILFVLFVTFFITGKINNRNAYFDSIKLTDDWSVDINGTEYLNVNLENFQFKAANKGDVITLSRCVPDCTFTSPVMMLVIYHAAFEIYSDDNLVYEYGNETMKKGKMLESGYNWVQLPSDIGNKNLRIVVKFNEPKSQSNFTVPVISEASSAFKYFISDNLSYICIGAFLFVFGVCIIITAVLLNIFDNDITLLIYTGIFSALIGLWIICNKGIINLVSDNRILNMWIEYFTLYVAPMPIILYIYKLRKGEHKFLFFPLRILLVCNVLLIAVTLVLHFVNILHFPVILTAYHMLILFTVSFFIFSSIYLQMKRIKIEENILLIGIILLAITAAIDIAFFNLGKYINPVFVNLVGISCIGSLFLIISMLFSFGLSMYKNMSFRIEQATLINLAFTDPLTKLSNREKLFRTISELIKAGRNYAIINFDVNHLKQNNDKYGHQTGDAMLRDFATVLTGSFKNADVVARVGGDEFYILYADPKAEQIEKALKDYEINLADINKEDKIYFLAAAYGVAYNTEVPDGNQDDVVQLSDRRMYAMKSKM